ncbi:methyltransferase small [Methylobacterium sp. 4-46]|uniref:tRNA1(Val) (adenine(37)-N6)-methyltransferase n=1 Tax=unclassified Methylobacterium TaxID=2615210 RepID=UPI000152DE83|nr:MULTISPECIES: methyltransferase [Methylobacterium]ACA17193.1 methyltransferase small [Methylobacterium sp. 4-46]WFT82875.1 methyltransferase [Methylobacterium nodulans]
MPPGPEPQAWLGGRLRLRQPPPGAHRAGTDAALLAAAAGAPEGDVYDLGAGTGAVGLAVALRAPLCRVVLVERDGEAAALARANAAANGLAGRVAVLEADVTAPAAARRAAGLMPDAADLVLTNPPFFEGAGHRPSPVAARAAAHALPEGGLDAWLRTCADLLRPGGRLVLIHRADALPTCLRALAGRFGAVAVRPVQPRAETPASRVLIAGRRGSRAPFALLPPLVLHGPDGRFTALAEALHRGEAVLA